MKYKVLPIILGIIIFPLGFMSRVTYIDGVDLIRALSPLPLNRDSTELDASDNKINTSSNIITYIYPAITDNKVLPNQNIPKEYMSNKVYISGSPGEYRPASFVIYSQANISSLALTISDLTGAKATIDKTSVDTRVVKVWYQAGLDILDINHKTLTPELLLRDDSLVNTDNGENYVKLTDGKYKWISDPTKSSQRLDPISIEDLPIKDSSTLQPVDIMSGTNKQFWITIKIPENAVAGNYSGQIKLKTPFETLGTIYLELTVLPINLLKPYLTYSIYYLGVFNPGWPEGSISCQYKSEEQFVKEMRDIQEHGIDNPTVYQGFDPTLLGQVLSTRNSLGLSDKPLYYLGLRPWGYQSIEKVKGVISLAKSYGISDVYFYGEDEAAGTALSAQRGSWQEIRTAGGKIFVAGYTADRSPPGNYSLVGDILDLFICEGKPNAEEAAKWHSVNHQIFSYANPQAGVELPETYRRNYGLLLWQQNFDGAMDFAYQYAWGNIWNDFDNVLSRNHNMAYPTIDGVVDTIQWEGFREGVNDIRYLTTLLNIIKKAKASGEDTSDVETWLDTLKRSDLTTVDLDLVRDKMIDNILYLQANQEQSPVLDSTDNKTLPIRDTPGSAETPGFRLALWIVISAFFLGMVAVVILLWRRR